MRTVLYRMASDGLLDRVGTGKFRWPAKNADETAF